MTIRLPDQSTLEPGQEGITILAGDSSTPPTSRKIRWVKESDGSQVADTFGYFDPTGVGFSVARLNSYFPGTVAFAALLTQATQTSDARILAIARDAANNTVVKTIITSLGVSDFGPSIQPNVYVQRNVNLAVNGSAGNPTIIPWDTEVSDPDNMWDPAISSTRLTCRTAGKWLITANIFPQTAPTGGYQYLARVSGSAQIYRSNASAPPGWWEDGISGIVTMSVGDYLEIAINNYAAAGYNIHAEIKCVRVSE
jgi:hypothetical protein